MSGRGELNSGYMHPMHAYYRYTTPRILILYYYNFIKKEKCY